MTKKTKKNKIITDEIKDKIIFKIDEAIATSKKFASKKFDETLDVIVVLGIDAKKSDQQIRGVISLPKMPSKKIKVAVFGFANLNTNPGNCSGLYSVSGNFFVISSKSIFCSTEADATTFTTLTIGFVSGMRGSLYTSLYILVMFSQIFFFSGDQPIDM